jgi:hypothetical protein
LPNGGFKPDGGRLVFLRQVTGLLENGALGQLLTAGSDVWLSPPQPPREASVSSGVKMALNGLLCLSGAGRLVGRRLLRRRDRLCNGSAAGRKFERRLGV